MDGQKHKEIKSNKRIAVFGWYNVNNIGDESFKLCFKHLWPNTHFDFISDIPLNINEEYGAIIFGGGNLLDYPIENVDIIQIPIFLIGIEYNANNKNKSLFDKAKIIITRNPSPYIVASDLCFSLPEIPSSILPKQKTVSIFLNDFLTPRKNSIDWITASHSWFIHEFSDICDTLIEQNYRLNFIPFCVNPSIDDRKAASFVLSKMKNRKNANWIIKDTHSYADIQQIIGNSSLVITQRLHGSIFSYIRGIPQIAITHHSKMTEFCNHVGITNQLNYYGFHKDTFFKHLNKVGYNPNRLPYLNTLRNQWQELSNTVAKTFNL